MEIAHTMYCASIIFFFYFYPEGKIHKTESFKRKNRIKNKLRKTQNE